MSTLWGNSGSSENQILYLGIYYRSFVICLTPTNRFLPSSGLRFGIPDRVISCGHRICPDMPILLFQHKVFESHCIKLYSYPIGDIGKVGDGYFLIFFLSDTIFKLHLSIWELLPLVWANLASFHSFPCHFFATEHVPSSETNRDQKSNQKTPPLCIFWLNSWCHPHIGKLLGVF